MIMKKAKTFAKKVPGLAWLAKLYKLQWGIPATDWLNPGKIRLIFKVKPYSLVNNQGLSRLYDLAALVEMGKIGGDFVECGVCKGGSAGIISKVILKDRGRRAWLFDSWEGLPEAKTIDVTSTGTAGEKGMYSASENSVKELLFERLRLNPERVHLSKGWFSKTIPSHKNKIEKISLLHLDSDLYESTKFCLEELYSLVVKGGFVVIDDYGSWLGCKKAVDEFIAGRNEKIELIELGYSGVYFRK